MKLTGSCRASLPLVLPTLGILVAPAAAEGVRRTWCWTITPSCRKLLTQREAPVALLLSVVISNWSLCLLAFLASLQAWCGQRGTGSSSWQKCKAPPVLKGRALLRPARRAGCARRAESAAAAAAQTAGCPRARPAELPCSQTRLQAVREWPLQVVQAPARLWHIGVSYDTTAKACSGCKAPVSLVREARRAVSSACTRVAALPCLSSASDPAASGCDGAPSCSPLSAASAGCVLHAVATGTGTSEERRSLAEPAEGLRRRGLMLLLYLLRRRGPAEQPSLMRGRTRP